jgi:predicted deoxyguanosinetriphosphate triphosphohydrolase
MRSDRCHTEDEPDHPRDPWQRDRDRILYSDALQRLANVTQVASPGEGIVFHNRLTHTHEVAQIARRLAEKLRTEQPQLAARCDLNPDVVEAAALAHDLGHPPFGHIAEEELDRLASANGAPEGFEGNAQSFRIIVRTEPHRIGYRGLDLTRATLNAVLKYPWQRDTRAKGADLSSGESSAPTAPSRLLSSSHVRDTKVRTGSPSKPPSWTTRTRSRTACMIWTTSTVQV